MGLGSPSSEAIPISINARSAYSPRLNSFMSTKSVGNQNNSYSKWEFLLDSPARFFYWETSRGEVGNLITNLLPLPGSSVRAETAPPCILDSELLLASRVFITRRALFARIVTEAMVQRRHRLISIFNIAGTKIIGIPANSPSPHIE